MGCVILPQTLPNDALSPKGGGHNEPSLPSSKIIPNHLSMRFRCIDFVSLQPSSRSVSVPPMDAPGKRAVRVEPRLSFGPSKGTLLVPRNAIRSHVGFGKAPWRPPELEVGWFVPPRARSHASSACLGAIMHAKLENQLESHPKELSGGA